MRPGAREDHRSCSGEENQRTSFMMSRMNRREFFAGVGMVAAAARSVVGQSRRTRLVLLGTGGGPRPRTTSSASAQVIVSKSDIDIRIANEGRVPLAPLVRVHEVREGGPVMADDNLKVTATLVDHPPVVPAFAYRFDAADRSIVISGDTAPSRSLVKLAAGADVLVHSVMYPPAIDRLVARVPNAAALKASILAHQTSAEDAGRIAQDAGVKTLVLSHFVPPDDPAVTDAMWLEAAGRHFPGTVTVGKDLLEI
jgi:ribonuclease BN (tRNA processing enzyme)